MPYQEPRIDRNWRDDNVLHSRPFLAVGIALLLMVLALSLTLFKGCTGYGAAGKHDIYNPADSLAADEGFAGIANTLFDTLLTIKHEDIPAVDIQSLNRRYPAIEFALPYNENHLTDAEVADLRVVAIHPEYIHDKHLRDFYYNSRLPQLLNRQRDNMAESYFRIHAPQSAYDTQLKARPLNIDSIRINKAMFKVALVRNPWKGTITAVSNCLFPQGQTLYLAYGNSMIPLPIEQEEIRQNYITYHADNETAQLTNDTGQPIDYYKHYQQAFDTTNPKRTTCVAIEFSKDKKTTNNFSICCTKGKLHLRLHDTQLIIYNGQPETPIIKADPTKIATTTIDFVDGMKIIAYNAAKTRKLGEFTLTTTDPTNTLSRLVQTQTGASRYNIAATQTDLFTQQMVRALSQHLSNRTGTDNVTISLDPMLSREFENELRNYIPTVRQYINTHKDANGHTKPQSQTAEQYDISLTILDLATGNIIAQPFYTTKFDNPELPDELRLTTRNVALARRYLGSTFKPIMALAAIETDTTLLNLQLNTATSSRNGDNARFFGYNVTAWAKETRNWGADCNFTQFIAHSDDVYPAALAAWALSKDHYTHGATTFSVKDPNSLLTTQKGTLKFRAGEPNANNLENCPFAGWLNHITAANTHSGTRACDSLFRHLPGLNNLNADDRCFGIEEVSPDVTNLHLEQFTQGGDFRNTLIPWVLGQGSNDWSALQIATAWARILSGHAVQASYIYAPDAPKPKSLFEGENVPESLCDPAGGHLTPAQRRNIWAAFLDKFNAAQTADGGPGGRSTLQKMATAVDSLNTKARRTGNDRLLLFSKTGTPDAYTRNEIPTIGSAKRYFDVGLYTFGLMTAGEMQRAKQGKQPKGIVCVIRITRTYQCPNCDKAGLDKQCSNCSKFEGLGSGQARNFFSQQQHHLIKLYDMTRRYY